MATEEFKLNIWRCHPKAARLIPAEKTLNGTANPAGVQWCRPYSSANQMGWWLFPAIDIDIMWTDNGFERKTIESYSNSDHQLVKSLIRPTDKTEIDKWCPEDGGRSKFSFGDVEPHIVQFWTGLILETPPGWALQVRNPINFARRSMMCIMEGVVETDWMQYDLWVNMVFDRKGEWLKLRKNEFPPLAQIIPVRRESIDGDWQVGTDQMINRDTPEANRVFEYWVNYNNQKFGSGGKQAANRDGSVSKDSTTFHRERMKCLGKEMEPKPAQVCPFAHKQEKPKLKLKTKLLTKRSK